MLEKEPPWWDIPTMSVTVDSKKRVILPGAKPGEEFDVQATGDGIFVLRRLQPVQDRPIKGRLVKRGKYTVCVTDRPIDMAALNEALADFP
jgi:hypothetical protein